MRWCALQLIILTALYQSNVEGKAKFDVKPQQNDSGKTEYAFQGKVSRDEIKNAIKMAKTAGKIYSMYRNTKDPKSTKVGESSESAETKRQSSSSKSSRVNDSDFTEFSDDDFDSAGSGSSFHKNVSIKYTRTTTV
jgi:hypothetical protein